MTNRILTRQEKYIQLFDEDKSGNYVASHRRPIYDSNGAFLIAELGNIDTQLHLPLEKVTFGEDVSPRLGVQVTDEVQEWTNTYGSVNGTGGITGKPWVNQGAQDAANVDSTTVMFKQNVYNIKLAVSWTELELMKAQRLQRPIDVDRITILEKHWANILDHQAYLGDTTKSLFGLANADASYGCTADWAVNSVNNAPTGGWNALIVSSPTTAAELILADLFYLDQQVYNNTMWTTPATKFLIPASVWQALNTPLMISGVPVAMSIREYFEKHAIAATEGKTVTLAPRKWLNATIPGNTFGNNLVHNRVVAYSNDYDFVRFEYSQLANSPVTFWGDRQTITYYGTVGGCEFVNPTVFSYLDQV